MRTRSVDQMVEAGIEEGRSGALYTLILKRAWEIVLLWKTKGELRVNADLDRRQLAEDLHQALLADLVHSAADQHARW